MKGLIPQTIFCAAILILQVAACSSPSTEDSQTESIVSEYIYTPEPEYCFDEVETARLVGELYNLAGVLKSSYMELQLFLRENDSAFARNSALTACMRDFGIFLQTQGHISYSKNPHSEIYEDAINVGANPDQARVIANDMTRDAGDMVLIGKEMVWLSEVIPSAVEGDWSLFQQSGTEMRQQVRMALVLMQQMNDPSMNAFLQDAVSQFEPYMTEYIASLALMSDLEVR